MSDHAAQFVDIPLTHLQADEAYQPRLDGLRESHVQLLMASDPAAWPPLVVTPNGDGTYIPIDGRHQHEAGTRLGLISLPCIIDTTAGYPEAFAANLRHGLPLTLADRKDFARWLAAEEPGLSYRELGRRSGLNHETVKRALEEEDAEGGDHRHRSQPDPIDRLVRLVERTYREGHGQPGRVPACCGGLCRGGSASSRPSAARLRAGLRRGRTALRARRR